MADLADLASPPPPFLSCGRIFLLALLTLCDDAVAIHTFRCDWWCNALAWLPVCLSVCIRMHAVAGSSRNMLQCMNHLHSLGFLTEGELEAVAYHTPLRLLNLSPEDVSTERVMGLSSSSSSSSTGEGEGESIDSDDDHGYYMSMSLAATVNAAPAEVRAAAGAAAVGLATSKSRL